MGHLPEQAKKVFSGVVFDVYQWQQDMYDGTRATFEMLKRADTGEVLAVKDDKIMIQVQEQPMKPQFFCLPGGRIEEGEDPQTGAARELLEETGHVASEWKLFHAVEPHSKYDWTIYVFVARGCEYKQPQQLDGGEKIQVRWVTFDELLDLVDKGELAWMEQDLRMQLIRAKYHEPSRIELKKRIFGG